MSTPIRVKLYKNNVKQNYPERFMTLSYGAGFGHIEAKFYPNQIINQVIEVLNRAGEYTLVKENLSIPEYDLIEIDYYGMKISKNIFSTIVKIEGDRPLGIEIDLGV